MNLKRKFHRDLNRYQTPASPIAETHRESAAYRPRKKWLTAPVAVAMAILLTVSASAACGVIIHYLNNEVITENNTRLTEIPEGYVGIYSVADLVTLRENVKNGVANTHYILMSDITFTDADYAEGGICEGGWESIPNSGYNSDGHYVSSPIVMFNGNGHVIRNLRSHVNYYNGTEQRLVSMGLFAQTDYHQMTVINLGMEDCVFRVENPYQVTANSRTRYQIGAIAGSANYIGGCYVNGMTVEIRADFRKETDAHLPARADNEYLYINVGGLAGETIYADACYAENVTVRVIAQGEGKAIKLRAGGIAGIATSSLNCWTDETTTITADGQNYAICEIAPIANLPVEYMIPAIMTEEAFDEMMAVIAEANSVNYVGEPIDGTKHFNYKMTLAYYVRREVNTKTESEMLRQYTYDALAQANELYRFLTRTDEWHDVLYIFDPGTSTAEYERLGAIFLDAFGDEKAFREFCRQYSVRLGEISCYTFTEESKVKEKDLEGFDFDTLWTIVGNRPRLRIFAN